MNRLAITIIGFLISATSSAATLEDIYADIDAKIMSSNSSVYSMYAPNASVVMNQGLAVNPEVMRGVMNEMIRNGVKYDVHQSKILETREIRSGVMKNLMAVVVVSEDYMKLSGPDDKDSNKRKFEDLTAITTRVFDTSNPNQWLIVSEQSTPVKKPK